ncbi:MAG: hypothetical protein O3C60_02075 [Planctomycetota bacterium]|nr:hypothetical protein [Planctomycetota bacterium]
MQCQDGCVFRRRVAPFVAAIVVCALCFMLVSCEQTAPEVQPAHHNPNESPARPSDQTAGTPSTPVEGSDNGPGSLAPDEWSSPTDGTPWPLRYISAGTPWILMWRPAAMHQCDGHELILRALGADFVWLSEQWRERTGTTWNDVTRLTLGLQPQDQGLPRPVVVAEFDSAWPWPSWWETAQSLGAAPNLYRQHDGWCFYAPPEQEGRTLVLASLEDMPDIVLQGDIAPVLQRQMQQLLRETDSDRHVTVLTVPSFLFADGRPLFRGSRESIPGLMHRLLGARLQGLSLSLHFEQYWFTELRAVPDITLPVTQYSVQFREQVEQIPQRVDRYLAGVTITDDWKKLATRLPKMAQYACDQVRMRVDHCGVQATMALPLPAAHNLILATDLALQADVVELPSLHVK